MVAHAPRSLKRQMRPFCVAHENEEKQPDRFASTLVIAASIIAAVRLARDDIGTPSPKVMCAVADSVQLAKMILRRVVGS